MPESQKKPQKKAKKVIITSIVAAAVVSASLIGYHIYANSQSSVSITTFRKTTAAKGSVSTTVSGSGSVSDANQLTLTAANAGTIDSLPVKQGDSVKAGQTIAHIDSTASAQAVLQKQNSLTSAKNQLAQAEQNLDSLTIKAPVAGRIKSITASAGDSLSTIKPLGDLAVISTSRSMTVSFSASQTVSVGQSVTVVDTSTNSSYNGTITSTSTSGISGNSGSTRQQTGIASGSAVATIGTDKPAVGNSATVKSGSTVIGSGTFQLEKYISISNTGNGTVSNVYVSENQMVNKNQSLFKLGSNSADQQVSTAQAAVTAAQNDLDSAEASAKKDTITSPVDGIVAQLNVKDGDSVASGTTVAVIIDPSDMQTVLSVDELDISSVAVGQKATITLDAISGKTFSGTVTQVDPIGTNSNGVAAYSVTVSIASPDEIKVGMTTNAEIITKSADNVTVVPASAILEKNGDQGYVLPADKLFDANGKSLQLNNVTTASLVQTYGKQVTIGMATADKDEIVSGVSDGESLAIPVTTNKAAIKSLSNTNNNNTTNGFSGMRGFSGMTGGSTTRTNRDKTGGTGNTVAKSNNGETAANNGTAGDKSGGTGTTGTNGTTGGISGNR